MDFVETRKLEAEIKKLNAETEMYEALTKLVGVQIAKLNEPND